jgi:hypothetical protein
MYHYSVAQGMLEESLLEVTNRSEYIAQKDIPQECQHLQCRDVVKRQNVILRNHFLKLGARLCTYQKWG